MRRPSGPTIRRRPGARPSWSGMALLVAALAGCGSGSGSDPGPSSSSGPLIVAVVASLEPSAAVGGAPGSAVIRVLDPTTGASIGSATVSVNGSTMAYDGGLGAFTGTLPVPPGATVQVTVATSGGTWAASGTQVPAFPVIVSPTTHEVWSGMRSNVLEWTVPIVPAGAFLVPAVVDATGAVEWPGDGLQRIPATASSVTVPPAALTPGSKGAVVALASEASFPGAAPGSVLVLEGASILEFEARNGVQVAPAAGAAHLHVASGMILWSEGGPSTVKTVPAVGGPARPIVNAIPMPESVQIAGSHLYFISGNQLLRAAIDGTGVEVLATGQRDYPFAGTTDLVVDDSDVYWVNTAGARTWIIVRTPLTGGPSTPVATVGATVVGLASDGSSIYWEQEGDGPVSADGMAPTDSAVMAVAKQGGAVRMLVNGFQNGPAPSLPPGQIPGNWFGRGGIVVAGGDLVFADTGFNGSYRLLRVSTAGGPLTVLHSVTGGDSGTFVRRMSTDGTTLFWIDRTSVNSIPLVGGATTRLADGIYEATSLAVAGGSVVWTENVCCSVRQNGLIRISPAGGGAVGTLATLRDNPGPIATDGSAAFWVEGGSYGAIEGYGGIGQVPLSGAGPTMLLSTLSTPHPPIATDGTTVFVADGWRVKSAALAGGALGYAIVGSWTMVDTDTDGRSVFGLDSWGNVLSAPIDGGPATLLAAGASGPAAHLRHAAGYVYWVDRGDTLKRVPAYGGPVETLATLPSAISDLVADANAVYLAEQAMGRIFEVPASGGSPVVLANGTGSGPVAMALSGSTLYWIDAGHIGKVDLTTGNATLLARGISADPAVPGSIAVDDTAVYWTEATGIRRGTDR